MKNDKEKVKKLFNLLKDGMDLLTNDQHRGVEINISSEPISYFSILDKNDEREANIFVNTTPKEVIDKTLRTFNTLGRDAKTLENLDYGEEFESYKNAGKKMWDYPALDQYELIKSAKPLKALEDLDLNLDFDEYNIKIDSLRNKDYDNSRWHIFIKEGNQIFYHQI